MSKFPEIEYFGVWMKEYRPPNQFGYSDNAVRDWFKRCMSSRPSITPARRSKWTRGMTGDDMMNRYPIHPTHEDWVKWFKKWFSQFIEKGDNDE